MLQISPIICFPIPPPTGSLATVVEGVESGLFSLAARPSAAASSPLLSHARPTPSLKTRVGGLPRCPSGRPSFRPRRSPVFAPGNRACGYKVAPGRSKWLSRDPIGENGGPNLYCFIRNSSINFFDPLGLKQYTEQETQNILNQAYCSATSGRFSGLWHIYHNSKGRGPYDYGWLTNNEFPGPDNDTFVVNGDTLTADQFGNFIAGYKRAGVRRFIFFFDVFGR